MQVEENTSGMSTEARDRLPSELCVTICAFLGTEDQRILRRAIGNILTCSPERLDTFEEDAPVKTLIFDYIPSNQPGVAPIDINILLDRRQVLVRGEFRRIVEFRYHAAGEFPQHTENGEHDMCLADYVEHCAHVFERLSPQITGLDDHQMAPATVSDVQILWVLFGLRFTPPTHPALTLTEASQRQDQSPLVSRQLAEAEIMQFTNVQQHATEISTNVIHSSKNSV